MFLRRARRSASACRPCCCSPQSARASSRKSSSTRVPPSSERKVQVQVSPEGPAPPRAVDRQGAGQELHGMAERHQSERRSTDRRSPVAVEHGWIPTARTDPIQVTVRASPRPSPGFTVGALRPPEGAQHAAECRRFPPWSLGLRGNARPCRSAGVGRRPGRRTIRTSPPRTWVIW